MQKAQCEFKDCDKIVNKYSKSENFLCRPHRNIFRNSGKLEYTNHQSNVKDFKSEYRAWVNMKVRCNIPSHPQYKDYGGRGIRVSDEFNDSFPAFLEYIRAKPSKYHTLDRIDNEKGYERGNIKWSTRQEQVQNRRNAGEDGWEYKKILLKKRYSNLETGINWSNYRQAWRVIVTTPSGQMVLYSGKNRQEAEKRLLDYANSL